MRINMQDCEIFNGKPEMRFCSQRNRSFLFLFSLSIFHLCLSFYVCLLYLFCIFLLSVSLSASYDILCLCLFVHLTLLFISHCVSLFTLSSLYEIYLSLSAFLVSISLNIFFCHVIILDVSFSVFLFSFSLCYFASFSVPLSICFFQVYTSLFSNNFLPILWFSFCYWLFFTQSAINWLNYKYKFKDIKVFTLFYLSKFLCFNWTIFYLVLLFVLP